MSETVHATALSWGRAGLLIRGASGAGKSSLALALIGRGARLVADDRVHLSACHGRLIATAPSAVAGSIELRGRGILPVPHERSAIVRLVVDIVAAEELERMPDEPHLRSEILGLGLPRQAVTGVAERAIPLIEAALGGFAPHGDMGLRSPRVWG
jgi:HPr kinase/phosphorylase